MWVLQISIKIFIHVKFLAWYGGGKQRIFVQNYMNILHSSRRKYDWSLYRVYQNEVNSLKMTLN